MAVDPLIELMEVNKRFGELHVLKDINLTVGRGEVAVVIGPSGSGKSTLCRAINRLEPIESGTIRLDGQLLPDEGKPLARLRAEVGMVFQSFNLFAHKTVLQNVSLGQIEVRARKKDEADQRSHELLDPGRSRLARAEVPADGRIVEDRTPEEFFTDPRNDRAKDFLSKILMH
ncbi:ATP-binding cassette domain-containing protein [Streptomyces sp. B21-083]|uniref:ATP-binding cassette domain-containing protein n=1 Tax=Streptomyces sp. B21-083 TaxID=3039410 RepID=UPI002FEF22B8